MTTPNPSQPNQSQLNQESQQSVDRKIAGSIGMISVAQKEFRRIQKDVTITEVIDRHISFATVQALLAIAQGLDEIAIVLENGLTQLLETLEKKETNI